MLLEHALSALLASAIPGMGLPTFVLVESYEKLRPRHYVYVQGLRARQRPAITPGRMIKKCRFASQPASPTRAIAATHI